MSLIKRLIKSKDMIELIAMGPGISTQDYLTMVDPIVEVINKLRKDGSATCTREDFEMLLDHNTTNPDEPNTYEKAKQFMDDNLILYRKQENGDGDVHDILLVDWQDKEESHHYTIPYDKVWSKITVKL